MYFGSLQLFKDSIQKDICSTINSQNLEKSQISKNQRADKEAMVNVHNGILFGYKKG